jgi:myosin heavy subunit
VNSIEGISDLEEFNEVRSAMEVLGMSNEDQMNVCKVVAGILHIGNISKFGARVVDDGATITLHICYATCTYMKYLL